MDEFIRKTAFIAIIASSILSASLSANRGNCRVERLLPTPGSVDRRAFRDETLAASQIALTRLRSILETIWQRMG